MSGNILKDTAVVILAAGFSGRMGIPKLALPFDEKQTFAQKIIRTYQAAGCAKAVLVINRQGEEILQQKKTFLIEETISVVLNLYPSRERFYSLQTGLKAAGGFRAVFVQNIDNPFVTVLLLQQLAAVFEPDKWVVPRYNGHGGHPVLLSRKIVRDIVHLPGYGYNLRDFLQSYPQINCPVNDESILANINSPETYRIYFGKDPY